MTVAPDAPGAPAASAAPVTPATLGLRFESCVRAVSVSATCDACVTSCPTGAVGLGGVRETVEVDLAACTGCGHCAAACPTNAFDAPFDLRHVLRFAGPTLRCGEDGLPCISALSAEDMLVLVSRTKHLVIADEPCGHCPGIHHRAHARAQQANQFLAASGLPGSVRLKQSSQSTAVTAAAADAESNPKMAAGHAPASERRQWFKSVVKKVVPESVLRQPERLDMSLLQTPSPRRQRLLAVLARANVTEPPVAVPEEELGFISSKQLDTETCTACSICVRVCPTGALQADRRFRELSFDASQCVKCRLCHDVCAPNALTLADQTSLAALVVSAEREAGPQSLGRLQTRSCAECGARYNAAAGGRGLCPRCVDMELEAIELSRRSR
ncbi:MAG: 4Fe-4S binding protein [Myxococcales bacterium]|nr:4Fe-4S binding protein [Myxococcales bacterium]